MRLLGETLEAWNIYKEMAKREAIQSDMYIKLSRKAFEVRQMQAADTIIEVSMGFNNKDCEPWTLFQIGVLYGNKDMTPNKGKLFESTLENKCQVTTRCIVRMNIP